jgi:hypothetical protein
MDVCAEIVVEDVIAHLAKNHKKLVSAVGRPKSQRQQLKPDAA